VRCFHPLDAYQLGEGKVVFSVRGGMDIRRELKLRCGRCIGCRLFRSQEWATRVMHEASMHDCNSFVTLTYDDENVPRELVYRHFQLFMKRLRKQYPGSRFFMCGEYGEEGFRPHFHACLFGVHFSDRTFWRRLPSGHFLYRSESLERLWRYGFSSIGDVTFDSAAYVARYCVKKVVGNDADQHYWSFDVFTGEAFRVEPEFARMSLKPGIGVPWAERFSGDLEASLGVVRQGGGVCAVPRRYDAVLGDRLVMDLEFKRFEHSLDAAHDNEPDRMAVLEEVASARLKFKQRCL